MSDQPPRPYRCLEHGLTFQTWEAFFRHLKEQHAAAIGDTASTITSADWFNRDDNI